MRRPVLTYANVMSTVGVFIALGGTGYAVTKLPKNSVGALQIKDGAVTAAKLAPGTALTGPRGPRGAEGRNGADGARGADGVARGYVTRSGSSSPIASSTAGGTTVASLRLPAGSWALDFGTHVFSNDPTATFVDCGFKVGGTDTGHTATKIGEASGAAREAQVSLHDLVTITGTTVVGVQCSQRDVSRTVLFEAATLRALQVTRAEEQ